jgi:general stress protein CsbA
MKNKGTENFKWLLTKSSVFVFIHAIGSYLVLILINASAKGFIAELFNIKIPLFVAVVSGLVFVMTHMKNDEKDDDISIINVE